MSDPIWDGKISDPETALRRAEGQDIPFGTTELNKLVTEIIATQKGTLAANNGVKDLTRRLTDLQTRVDNTAREELQVATDELQNLTTAITAGWSAVSRLLEQLIDEKTGLPDWSALAKGLTAYGNTTAQAFQGLCAELAHEAKDRARRDLEKDELLGEYCGDIERLRFDILRVMEFRRFTHVLDDMPDDYRSTE